PPVPQQQQPMAPVAHIVPAQHAPAIPGSALIDMGRRFLQSSAGLQPGNLPVAHVPPEPVYVTGMRYSSIFIDALIQVPVLTRILVAPGHSLWWLSRILPIVLPALIITIRWWGPDQSTPFGFLLAQLVTVVLAYALFKILGHEIRRYQQTSPDLPPHLRN